MLLRLCLPGRIATACKGAYGAIPAIANSPATPNAWPQRAELTPIAGSIPCTRSRASGAAPIGTDTERQYIEPISGFVALLAVSATAAQLKPVPGVLRRPLCPSRYPPQSVAACPSIAARRSSLAWAPSHARRSTAHRSARRQSGRRKHARKPTGSPARLGTSACSAFRVRRKACRIPRSGPHAGAL